MLNALAPVDSTPCTMCEDYEADTGDVISQWMKELIEDITSFSIFPGALVNQSRTILERVEAQTADMLEKSNELLEQVQQRKSVLLSQSKALLAEVSQQGKKQLKTGTLRLDPSNPDDELERRYRELMMIPDGEPIPLSAYNSDIDVWQEGDCVDVDAEIEELIIAEVKRLSAGSANPKKPGTAKPSEGGRIPEDKRKSINTQVTQPTNRVGEDGKAPEEKRQSTQRTTNRVGELMIAEAKRLSAGSANPPKSVLKLSEGDQIPEEKRQSINSQYTNRNEYTEAIQQIKRNSAEESKRQSADIYKYSARRVSSKEPNGGQDKRQSGSSARKSRSVGTESAAKQLMEKPPSLDMPEGRKKSQDDDDTDAVTILQPNSDLLDQYEINLENDTPVDEFLQKIQ